MTYNSDANSDTPGITSDSTGTTPGDDGEYEFRVTNRLRKVIIIARGPEDASTWLSMLPSVVNDHARRWGVRLTGVPGNGSMSCCVYGEDEYKRPVVLKIPFDRDTGIREAALLRAWSTRGAAPSVLMLDDSDGVMLMTRVQPGVTAEPASEDNNPASAWHGLELGSAGNELMSENIASVDADNDAISEHDAINTAHMQRVDGDVARITRLAGMLHSVPVPDGLALPEARDAIAMRLDWADDRFVVTRNDAGSMLARSARALFEDLLSDSLSIPRTSDGMTGIDDGNSGGDDNTDGNNANNDGVSVISAVNEAHDDGKHVSSSDNNNDYHYHRVLLHGDLQPKNILVSSDGELMAIDPFGCIGDPVIDLALWVVVQKSTVPISKRIRQVASATGIPWNVLRMWSIILAIAELRPYDLTYTPRMAAFIAGLSRDDLPGINGSSPAALVRRAMSIMTPI